MIFCSKTLDLLLVDIDRIAVLCSMRSFIPWAALVESHIGRCGRATHFALGGDVLVPTLQPWWAKRLVRLDHAPANSQYNKPVVGVVVSALGILACSCRMSLSCSIAVLLRGHAPLLGVSALLLVDGDDVGCAR